MNANTMELNPEQLQQITGADVMGMETRYPDDCCHHPHAVKTSWQREDEFFIFWTRHQFAYLCPDCKKIFWVYEEP